MNLTHLIFLGAAILADSSSLLAETRYPHVLLTPDYGIVTEDDLAYDYEQQVVRPYDPNADLNSLHWQCFPVKSALARYRQWRATDSIEGREVVETVCSIEIKVSHGGEVQEYIDRRGHDLGYCRDFLRQWNRTTRSEEIVCLNGDGGSYYQDEGDERIKLWTWEKFKTTKGCYSYFYGQCNTKGCAKGKCPGTGRGE